MHLITFEISVFNKWTWSRRISFSSRISVASSFKKTEVKLELLTDTDISLIAEKGIKGGICHSIYWYEKANNKCMKDYDKNKESSNLKYFDVNKLYGWTMSDMLPGNKFKWVEDISEFDESFINDHEESNEGYILEVDVQYPENLHT